MMRTSLPKLIQSAIDHDCVKDYNGNWNAVIDGNWVNIYHYDHRLIRININDNYIDPIDDGWQSMSDKCGITRIVNGYGIQRNWNDIFKAYYQASELQRNATHKAFNVIDALATYKPDQIACKTFIILNQIRRNDMPDYVVGIKRNLLAIMDAMKTELRDNDKYEIKALSNQPLSTQPIDDIKLAMHYAIKYGDATQRSSITHIAKDVLFRLDVMKLNSN